MNADKVSESLKTLAPAVPSKTENPRFLFTIKVVVAEGLIPLDGSLSTKLDTFVTLSDEHGNRLAKTRTIYEQADPRCKPMHLFHWSVPLFIRDFRGRDL